MAESPKPRRNGYPSDWKLLQAYVPPELWRALQLNKIATGVSVAEYIRETLTAAICHTA